MITKKKTIIVGSLFGIIAYGLYLVAWCFGPPGSQFLQFFANPLMIVVALFMLTGSVMMRKEGALSIFSGVLLLIIAVGLHGVYWHVEIIGTLFRPDVMSIQGTQSFEEKMNIFLILSMVEGFLYGLHALFIGFSRQGPKGADDEEEDSLSVDQGSAFASTMEEKPKKEKKQKPAKNQDVEWQF